VLKSETFCISRLGQSLAAKNLQLRRYHTTLYHPISGEVGNCLWLSGVNPASFHPQQLGEGIFDHGEFGILTAITCLAADQIFRHQNDQTWQQK
jgi:hypothetical protein